MNLKEGTRRLGILLGVCGAVLGGCLAYGDARAVWDSHSAYRHFESIMASPTMHMVAKTVTARNESGQPSKNEFGDPLLGAEKSEAKDGSRDLFKANALLHGNHDGINKVHIDARGIVSSIELATGESIQRTPAPRLFAYLRPLLYPLFGFVLPWGTVRALTWVGSGFFGSSANRA